MANCSQCNKKVSVLSANLTGSTICPECAAANKMALLEQESAAYEELPARLLEKYLGDVPVSLLAFVYWGVTNDIDQSLNPIREVWRAHARVIGMNLDSYSGQVGLVAVAADELIFVQLGKVPFGETPTPSLGTNHLRLFLDSSRQPVVERTPLADVWCSEESSTTDNCIRFRGKLDYQVLLLQSYPSDVLGATTSAKAFVESVTAQTGAIPPETLLERLGSGAPPQTALVVRIAKDQSYLLRFRELLACAGRARRQAVLQGIGQLPLEVRSALDALFRNEAVDRRKEARWAWLCLGIAAAAPAALWVMAQNTSKRHDWLIITAILVSLCSFVLVMVASIFFARAMGAWRLGSARWLEHIATAIDSGTENRGRSRPPDGLVGVGVRFTLTEKGLWVDHVMPDSGAAAAGLQVGEVVTSIEDAPAAGMAVEEATRRIAGRDGTTVRVMVLQENGIERNVEVTRGGFGCQAGQNRNPRN